MGNRKTKTFKSGNSVALRLPKRLAIGPDERMVIEQHGDTLTVRRAVDSAEAKRELLRMFADMDAIGRPGEMQDRESIRIKFPDRAGLY